VFIGAICAPALENIAWEMEVLLMPGQEREHHQEGGADEEGEEPYVP